MPTSPKKCAPHRRGSAMVETVLALPVVMLFVVLVLGFGLAAKRLSPLQNTARYDSWRQATAGAPGPGGPAELGAAIYAKDAPSQLVRVNDHDLSLPNAVDEPLKADLSGDAEALADNILARFPRAVGSEISASHASGIPLFSALGFTDPVKRHAFRLDGDWRFANGIAYSGQLWAAYADGWQPRNTGTARLAPGIQSLFLSPLDQSLPGSNNLSNAIRAVYTAYPDYRGPNWILNPTWFPPGQ